MTSDLLAVGLTTAAAPPLPLSPGRPAWSWPSPA